MKIPNEILDELSALKQMAVDAAESYSDEAKEQAEKHDVPVSAINKYVVARVNDKMEKLAAEVDTLADLLGRG